MNQKERKMYEHYMESDKTSIYELYKKPSKNKKLMWEYSMQHVVPEDCLSSVRVWGNNNKFNIGWRRGDKLVILTKENCYLLEIHE